MLPSHDEDGTKFGPWHELTAELVLYIYIYIYIWGDTVKDFASCLSRARQRSNNFGPKDAACSCLTSSWHQNLDVKNDTGLQTSELNMLLN